MTRVSDENEAKDVALSCNITSVLLLNHSTVASVLNHSTVDLQDFSKRPPDS